ncbi:hypothetical protein [Campylobacter coli]|uniref:hypothetical protein n=1 Tax=Campylobacter coli TaxID=195 RepID=UPI001F2A56AF|nr:hypothetical protein [Campylobacter coli]
MFYSKEYSGFRNTYASIFEYEKNQGRSIHELCTSARFYEKEIDFLICLLLDLIYYDAKMSANENALMENIIVGLGLNLIKFREVKLKYEQIIILLMKKHSKNTTKRRQITITLEQAYEF